MSPLITIHDRTAVFEPQYMGSVQYYATLARYARAVIDTDIRYDKRQKQVHRCRIADVNGPLQLTVPVAHPQGTRRWAEVSVSSHGQWWSDHRISLESAYGRTPFFEYYIDRFLPLFADHRLPILELDTRADAIIRRILGLETQVAYRVATDAPIDDYRYKKIEPQAQPYYQIRADRLGFIPGLSILDLIFNLGPEAPLYLLAPGNLR